jgi:alkanesulfonate monooxygenase SsuD/methylene tetrahydromethanopterin reductase-like flavin-dependent oxidoreductase (luciferase family)
VRLAGGANVLEIRCASVVANLEQSERRDHESALRCLDIQRDGVSYRRDLDKLAELIRIVDASGVESIGTNDTSFVGGDAYVRATLIARTAKNAQVGIHPTNPLTREPRIMAAFLASIDAMTEGRAFMDNASGDSAVYNIGLVPATRAKLEDCIACVRDPIAKGEGTYDGRPQRVRWHGEAVRDRIPITLCAEGPRTLHLGGLPSTPRSREPAAAAGSAQSSRGLQSRSRDAAAPRSLDRALPYRRVLGTPHALTTAVAAACGDEYLDAK